MNQSWNVEKNESGTNRLSTPKPEHLAQRRPPYATALLVFSKYFPPLFQQDIKEPTTGNHMKSETSPLVNEDHQKQFSA